MAEAPSVTIKVRGQEFRLRTSDDPDALLRVADYLDETMNLVEARTGTVDSLDLALLTALNLARELVDLREGRTSGADSSGAGVDTERLAALIELAEEALDQPLSA